MLNKQAGGLSPGCLFLSQLCIGHVLKELLLRAASVSRFYPEDGWSQPLQVTVTILVLQQGEGEWVACFQYFQSLIDTAYLFTIRSHKLPKHHISSLWAGMMLTQAGCVCPVPVTRNLTRPSGASLSNSKEVMHSLFDYKADWLGV